MTDHVGLADMSQGSLTTFIADRFGNANSALTLNGGWTQVPSGIYFDTAQFTISVWIYPQSLGTSCRFLSFGNGESDIIEIIIQSTPQFAVSQGNTWLNYPVSPNPLVLNQWQLLVCTYDGSTFSIYINGTLSASASVTYTMPSLTRTQNWFGRSAFSTNGFSYSYLDDIRFYNVSLNQTEIIQLQNEISSTNSCQKTITSTSTSKTSTTAGST